MGLELADTSAWTNRHRSNELRKQFDVGAETGQVATCEMVMLELLWTARDHDDFAAARDELDALPRIAIGRRAWSRAMDVFQLFAARGPLDHRQVAIPDLLIAAAAEIAEVPVVHYDRDFELIAEITGQPMRAIAPLGSL